MNRTPIPRLNTALLTAGAWAGPVYVVVGSTQALTREGFNPTSHAWSLLTLGDLGWIQVANFVVTGLLTLALAIGIRRQLNPGPAGTWGALLVGVFGLSLVGAGLFPPDPMAGFPPGSPGGSFTIHGMLHFALGGVGFLAQIVGCFIFARRFAGRKEPGWAWFSLATGLAFGAAFFGIASGSGSVWIIVAFTVAIVLLFTWMTLLALRLRLGR